MLNWHETLRNRLEGYKSILFICSPGLRRRGELEPALETLKSKDIFLIEEVNALPTINSIQKVFNLLKNSKRDFDAVIAVGGGSVIDSAKCILAMLALGSNYNLRTLLDGEFKNIEINPLHFIAVPTTAGTGSEVTSFATVWDPVFKIKKSLENKNIKPAEFILDPRFLNTLSYANYLYPALDAVSHSLESIWNINASEESLKISFHALDLITEVIARPHTQLNFENYERLMIGSNLAGEAIEQTKTSIAHSISYPLTAYYSVPHGLAASFLIPQLIDVFLNHTLKDKFEDKLILRTKKIISEMNLEKKVELYCSKSEIKLMIPKMKNPSRFNTFLVDMNDNDLNELFE